MPFSHLIWSVRQPNLRLIEILANWAIGKVRACPAKAPMSFVENGKSENQKTRTTFEFQATFCAAQVGETSSLQDWALLSIGTLS